MRMIDVDIALKALVETTFGDSKDGAFSVRLAEPLTEKNSGMITNSEGARKMDQTWGKPASWVDYSGELNGEKLGIVLFEHPSSFHHPSRWHVRDYGLLAINPFGSNSFDKSAPVSKFVLPAGKSLRLRYRDSDSSSDGRSGNRENVPRVRERAVDRRSSAFIGGQYRFKPSAPARSRNIAPSSCRRSSTHACRSTRHRPPNPAPPR